MMCDSANHFTSVAMPQKMIIRDEEGHVLFNVAIPDEDVARLLKVSEEAGAPPAVIIASIVHDVLEDDAFAHIEADMPEPTHGGNETRN